MKCVLQLKRCLKGGLKCASRCQIRSHVVGDVSCSEAGLGASGFLVLEGIAWPLHSVRALKEAVKKPDSYVSLPAWPLAFIGGKALFSGARPLRV